MAKWPGHRLRPEEPRRPGQRQRSGRHLVDLGKFDAKTTVGIMRGAAETLGMKQSDVETVYLIVEGAADPTTPLALSLYVSGDYGGGTIVFTGDGTIKQVSYPS